MTPHYLLIDFANVVHGAWHWLGLTHAPNLSNEVPAVLEHRVCQKLRTIQHHCAGRDHVQCVLVLDEHSERKKRVYPAYKANHGPHSVPVSKVASRISDRFPHICVSPGNEADDTIATLCRRNSTGFNTVASSDQDLWQLISFNTRIFDPIRKVFIEQSHVEAKYGEGLRSHHVPLAKSLWGDGGDNVPISIAKSRKKLRPYAAETDGSLDAFLALIDHHWDNLDDTLRLNWLTGIDQLKLNYQLVKLDSACEILWGEQALARDEKAQEAKAKGRATT